MKISCNLVNLGGVESVNAENSLHVAAALAWRMLNQSIHPVPPVDTIITYIEVDQKKTGDLMVKLLKCYGHLKLKMLGFGPKIKFGTFIQVGKKDILIL